jgi:hypothetical protein
MNDEIGFKADELQNLTNTVRASTLPDELRWFFWRLSWPSLQMALF